MTGEDRRGDVRRRVQELLTEVETFIAEDEAETTPVLSPGRHRKRQLPPGWQVIKGGMAAFASPFVMLGHTARDHAVAAAATVAIPVAAGGALVVAEAPVAPVEAGPATSSVSVPHNGENVGVPAVAPLEPGLKAGPPRRPPVAQAGPPSSTTPTATPIPVGASVMLPLVSAVDNAPIVLPPLEPAATSAPEPEPELEAEQEPEPSPEPTTVAEAVLACVVVAAGGGLPDCAGIGG